MTALNTYAAIRQHRTRASNHKTSQRNTQDTNRNREHRRRRHNHHRHPAENAGSDKIEFKTRPLQGCTSGPCLFADIVLDVDGGRESFLPAAVSETEAEIPFCRPPFQRRGPESLFAGRRFSDGGRTPVLPAAVSATETVTPFCPPPVQGRRPESLFAGRRFRDGGRKPFLPAAVSGTETGNPFCRPPFQRRRPESHYDARSPTLWNRMLFSRWMCSSLPHSILIQT